MFYSNKMDFEKISQALSYSIEAVEVSGDEEAIEKLKAAQEDLKQALSYSMTRINV